MVEQVACKTAIYSLGSSCDRYPSVRNHFLEKALAFISGSTVRRDNRSFEVYWQKRKGR